MFSEPSGINRNGFIAGLITTASAAQHSAMWYEGIWQDIGGLGGTNSGAGQVNNQGLVLGGSETTALDPNHENFCEYGAGLQCLAYLWQNGVMTALPTLGGVNANWGGINNFGAAAGYAETNIRDPQCPGVPAVNRAGPQLFDFEAVVWGPRRVRFGN